MTFFADLHVHSRYSHATSRASDLEGLAWWAGRKGLSVIGTGDFTHPRWRARLQAGLEEAEPGLLRLRPEGRRVVGQRSGALGGEVRFQLTVELATVYRKDGRGRRVHHLVSVPDFGVMARLVTRLGGWGNLEADGRPMLPLDSRDLLELVLESGDGAWLIPAHVWTPWYALFGSRSGFDRIEECYGDLADAIFALETGLSSDPAMNRRVSALDGRQLVSFSDAHAPSRLGREATGFDTDLDYWAMWQAMRGGGGLWGTLEFFPEEGKYHHDGHRACAIVQDPATTRRLGHRCSVCGKSLTLGVLHRLEALADRPAMKDPTREHFEWLLPLVELLAQLEGVGVTSQRVQRRFERTLALLGPELDLLRRIPVEEIAATAGTELAAAIARVRANQVQRIPGYDGRFGRILLERD
ncbi:MAG: hypothetical protein HQL84_08695 [Magnetococcales bacterium]|nr:hypothetical protein [Magnetococcales bacterium]MBF0150108.1 hypothetical protein [Magnetococcales bacterium]